LSQEIAHSQRAHALLSASSASRWLQCTPSPRLEDGFQDSGSTFAAEGTLAHEIAELRLRKNYTEQMGTRKFNIRIKKFKENELYQDEMLKHTETYLEYIQGITHGFKTLPFVAIEKRLDFSAYVPEGFGTGDCLIISGSTLYVIDFKYGKGVAVSAEGNPQMKLYALGAYLEYGFLYDIQEVKMVIVQPRLFGGPSEAKMLLADLLAWGEEIKPIALKAFNGEGEYVPGDHCKFCRAKAQCRARAEEFSALADFTDKPPLITNEEVGAFLEKGQGIAAWIKALQDYALLESLKGNEVNGWKAVEGRGSRNYVDQDKAFEHLKINGIDEAIMYDRVPLTVPKIEKELGKKEYVSLLEEPGHVQKSTGKPTLAPSTDKRPAVTNSPEATVDFK